MQLIFSSLNIDNINVQHLVQHEWAGGIFGGNVVYTVNPLGSNKYQLDADTVASVKPDQLITAANARAVRLCTPRTAHYEYQLTSSTYMETVTAVLSMPAQAPKVTGIVTCK